MYPANDFIRLRFKADDLFNEKKRFLINNSIFIGGGGGLSQMHQ